MTKKAGIQNSEVVDLVTQDPKTGEFVMIMFEPRNWDGSDERISQIQKKLNNYLFFALNGQIEKIYPQALDRPLRFQLDCHSAPDEKTETFLNSYKQILAKEGITFAVHVL